MKKIGWIVPEICNVSLFLCNKFSTWKRKTKLFGIHLSSHIFFCRARTCIIIWKHFWKYWVITEIHNTFFSTLCGKDGNGATILFLELKTMIIGADAAEFWPSIFLLTYYCQRDLMFGVFLEINICASKVSIFVNFDFDLHFQGLN